MVYKSKKRKEPSSEFWYRQKVIDGILEISNSQTNIVNLNIHNISSFDFQLFKTAIRLFGSWPNAVNAAGLNYDEISILVSTEDTVGMFLDDDEIVIRILELNRVGEDLSSKYIMRVYPELWKAASSRRNFGAWGRALVAAGLDYRDITGRNGKAWNRAGILKSIYEIYQTVGDLSHDYIKSTYPLLLRAAKKYYNTWDLAVRHTGINPERAQFVVQIEPIKIFILTYYLNEIFSAVGRNIEPVNKIGDATKKSDSETTVLSPTFRDRITGAWVEPQFRSWPRDLEAAINTYLDHTDELIIYHLIGEPRKWYRNKVKFICIRDLYPEIIAVGRDDLIRDLNLMERGRIPNKYLEVYDQYLAQFSKSTS